MTLDRWSGAGWDVEHLGRVLLSEEPHDERAGPRRELVAECRRQGRGPGGVVGTVEEQQRPGAHHLETTGRRHAREALVHALLVEAGTDVRLRGRECDDGVVHLMGAVERDEDLGVHAVRRVQGAATPKDRYDAVLEAGEAIATTLGLVVAVTIGECAAADTSQ